MTDKEAYETLVKFAGGEKQILMIREMIHMVGNKKAADNMISAYAARKIIITDEYKEWIYQSFEYMSKQMSKSNN